jgi:hypothetical protein
MKITILGFLVFFFLFVPVNGVAASLLVVGSGGEVKVNVLSASDTGQIDIQKPASLEVSKIADTKAAGGSVVSLGTQDGRANLTVTTGDEIQQLDVSEWKEDIIEIEERPQVQKIRIQLEGGKFLLKQRGVSASTENQINIDSKSAELSVKTDSGDKFLSVLPYEAVQTLLKTKVVNEVMMNAVEILDESGSLAYKIEGNKVINFFDIYSYKIPVSSYISASTGEVLKVDSPTIYKYVTFLFV